MPIDVRKPAWLKVGAVLALSLLALPAAAEPISTPRKAVQSPTKTESSVDMPKPRRPAASATATTTAPPPADSAAAKAPDAKPESTAATTDSSTTTDQAKPASAPETATPPAATATVTPPASDDKSAKTDDSKDDKLDTVAPPASSPAPAATTTATPTPPGDAKADAGKDAKQESATAPPASAPPATPPAAAASAVPADPVVLAARQKLGDPAFTGKANKDDIGAAAAFYAERSVPIWVEKTGFNAKAKDAMDEVRKADDWGLAASAFDLPSLPAGDPSPEAAGEADAKLTLELMKYARYARGGRINPQSLSRILDQVPPVKDPKVMLTELTATDAPATYLRGLHPQHPQFEKLRQVLLKARGGATPDKDEPVDEALKIKIPDGPMLKLGSDHAQVALLRQRLKVPPTEKVSETTFDAVLVEAVKGFQREKGITASGSLTNGTRRALNSEGEPKRVSLGDSTQRILINMERWRWMPENLGSFYVWNNIPEFYTRVVKGNEEVFKEKIIIGLPEWATPVFSADMQYIIFNPSWGVPDGIKQRELLPRLRSAGGFFFFGGGGGDVLRAYGLTAYRGGKQIDPDSVNWSSVDIRQYSFVQPPGGKNPLGMVKFRFPNKHDVYMHDTIERNLFAQSHRALSHGCIRVQNPRQFAAILLAEGMGWSPEKVSNAIGGGGEITLSKPVPVHMTYFTAVVGENGKVSTFGDLYGHDSRLSAALTGRALRLEPAVETASSDEDSAYEQPIENKKGRKNKKSTSNKYSGPESLADAISGLLTN